MELYFSQYYKLDPQLLEEHGAFDISVVSDLPLFIDPFLLFNSDKAEYQELHAGIVRYLLFLRNKASEDLDLGLIAAWYRFKEVKQNWLGYTLFGNEGHALGGDFAAKLHSSLGSVLSDFGEERITKGAHLEKLGLIRGGVGRDSISDFTTNLIKHYLLQYTQQFVSAHLKTTQCIEISVPRARFNYLTESWQTERFVLPALGNDYVLLTPFDLLTRDETWISYPDMINRFAALPEALPNDQLRAQVNNYFRSLLRQRPTPREQRQAAQRTIERSPQLVDYYIRMKEDDGDRAESVSSALVADTRKVFVEQLRELLADLENRTDFYEKPWTSYDEALDRVLTFKDYVENRDGYRLINRNGLPFAKESEVQLFFGLAWNRSEFDLNREPNNGRGPVDFKVSFGRKDKSLIEFKLASNKALKRNLEQQVAIYEKANGTRTSVKAIIVYTAADQLRVQKVLRELSLEDDPAMVVIDARSDNKPSASKA